MRLARPLQLGSFFISIAFKGVFLGLLLLGVFKESLSQHVKGLNNEKFTESKSDMVSGNWSTSAIINSSSWDPVNTLIKSATTSSSPKINTIAIRKRTKNVIRKKRSKETTNTTFTINSESSQQPQISTEFNTVRNLPTSTNSSTVVITSIVSSTPTVKEHHIQIRTSTATTLTTKEHNDANWPTTSDHLFTTDESDVALNKQTFRPYTTIADSSGFSKVFTSVTESIAEKKLLENVTVPNIIDDDNETTLFQYSKKDLVTDNFDEVYNTSNTTEQFESNNVFDVRNESVESTTVYQKNIWPPPFSSNSADSIALNPTVEGVNGGRDLLGIGAIVGIILGVLLLVILVAGIFGFLIYNKRLRPLSEVKYPTDNCGYVDDTLRVSYMNNHIELPKENSEEMFSLDNDSFLNSLEAMTLQNYWAEDAKNTKV